MTVKEKIQVMINIHTRVVTGVFLFLCFYILWLPGDASIILRDIVGIQIIGLISAVAYLPLLSDKEVSKKRMIVYNFLYFAVINLSVMVMGYKLHWANFSQKGTVIAIEAMVIATYALVKLISYRVDYSEASKMNKKLKLRNKDLE